MSKELGKRLKLLRTRSKLTQQQVADALHMDRSTYAYYEGGTTEPGLKSIKILSEVFNVDPIMLLPDTDGGFAISLNDVTAPPSNVGGFGRTEKAPKKDMILCSISREEYEIILRHRLEKENQKEDADNQG